MIAMIFVSTSSSSDDSSENERAICYENDRHQNERRIRVQNFIETVIYRYHDQEFKENFRLSRNTFEYLLYLLRPHLEGPVAGFGRTPIPPEKQLYIALYVLGTPDSYRSITTKFDVGKATAWRAVKRVVKALHKYRNYFIRWPTHNEIMDTAYNIARTKKFPGTFGAVDGTLIKISAPKLNSQCYIDRKNNYSIQLQVICNNKLEFIHCYTGLPGSVHDMRAFKYSGVQQRFNEEYFPRNTHILGDSAYTIQNHVMVPYRDNGHLTVEQVYYNKVLSSTRMMVERAIGLLKLRWRYLIEKLPMRNTILIPYYIMACCILHNICLKNEDSFEFPIIVPNTIDDNAHPLQHNDAVHQQGIKKRDFITEFLSRE